MPYVSVNLAQTLNDEQKTDLARALSQAVTVFPGKPWQRTIKAGEWEFRFK